ncbi:MAG TPA: diguanylate cyclase [Rhodocyclaceae bacterium]|nr:diguanylate cyclase [Rhodocyclaceae bacterium]
MESEPGLIQAIKAAIDQAPTAMMITDRRGRIEYVNQAFVVCTGYGRDELLGRHPRMLMGPAAVPATYRKIRKTLVAGERWRGELVNVRKCGSEHWVSLAVSPVRDPSGRIANYIAVREDITERKRFEEGLRRLANFDALTGINNRRHLMELADLEWKRAVRYGTPLSLLVLDVDHFKQINDTHGHSVGDQAICLVAQACLNAVREIDVVGRYGGEEFVIVLPGTHFAGALELAERLRRRVAGIRIKCGQPQPISLTASIGVASLQQGDTFEQLLMAADKALYQAKRQGRDKVVAACVDC